MAVIETASSVSRGRPEVRTIGPLRIDPYLRDVRLNDRRLDLTRKEYELLCVLAGEPLRAFPREELLARVWGITEPLRTRTLDSHAARLRQKLGIDGDRFVVNVWGVGYRLADLNPGPSYTAPELDWDPARAEEGYDCPCCNCWIPIYRRFCPDCGLDTETFAAPPGGTVA